VIAAGTWPALEALDLDGRVGSRQPEASSLGDEGARAIAGASASFPALRRLAIGGGARLGADGIEAILASPLLGQLEELSITDALLQPAHIRQLVTSSALAKLRRLRLRQTYLTPEARAELLARAPEASWRGSLVELDLWGNSVIVQDSWPIRLVFGGVLILGERGAEVSVYRSTD
jgi:hypothetical protein